MVDRKLVFGFGLLFTVGAVCFGVTSYLPKMSRMAEFEKKISPAMIALETKSHNDERFLGYDQPGFEELKKLIMLETGYKTDFKIRGITHTKGVVFFCMESGGEDIYTMIAPMLTVQEWVKSEISRQ